MSDNGLTLEWTPKGNNGGGTLTARMGQDVLHLDHGNLARAEFRRKFIGALCKDRQGIERQAVEAELLRLAAAPTRNPETLPPDVGEYAIVRPERFIHRAVSGLAVAERAVEDGRVVGRWALLLRWADGKRESRPLADCLDLPDKSRLWVHPRPGEPLPTMEPGWSLAARRAWVEGAGAPDAAGLFRRLCERIAYFLDLPPEKAPGTLATLGLWSMLSYVYPVFDAVPYLYVGGPLGSGKSRVFEILSRLAFRPRVSSNLTAACLFRTLHQQGGVLLLDEAERLRESTPDVSDILSMLLAGYKRGGRATRLEPVGDLFKTVEFDVYGPKAVACIASLPAALASRCIPLTMFRAGPGSEKPRRRIDADPGAWSALRDDLHALAMEHGAAWLDLPTRSNVCPAMSGRHYELWQPLISLAVWLESSGADGLGNVLRRHALETIEAAQDDALPDADETLLRIAAEKVTMGLRFGPSDVLNAAQQADPPMFSRWMSKTVSKRLQLYGFPVPRRSTHGIRVFDVGLDVLRRIQQNYGVDLGVSSLSSLSSPGPVPVTIAAAAIPAGDASDASVR